MVPFSYVSPDGYKLGHWVVEKRQRYNTLPIMQIKKLEALGFVKKKKNGSCE